MQVTRRFAGCQHDDNYITSEVQLTTNGIDDTYSTREDMEQQDQTYIKTFSFAGQAEENEEPWSGPPDGWNP